MKKIEILEDFQLKSVCGGMSLVPDIAMFAFISIMALGICTVFTADKANYDDCDEEEARMRRFRTNHSNAVPVPQPIS